MAELVDALDLGSSGVTCESSSLSFRTIIFSEKFRDRGKLMEVSVESLDNLRTVVRVELAWSEVAEKEAARYNELRKRAKVPGFRPGKANEAVLRRHYGPEVRHEAAVKLLQETYPKIMKEHDFNPATDPEFDMVQLEDKKSFIYTITFESYPEFELVGLEQQTIIQYDSEVRDEDINGALERLQKQHANWVDSQGPAANGDKLSIDFVGKIESEVFPGGSGKDFSLDLGSNSMIPGFEAGLVGANEGDVRTLDLQFPESYHAEELRGKDVQFEVTVKYIQKPELPELNDEFAKNFDIADFEALKKELRDNLERDLAQRLKHEVRKQVFDKLKELNVVDIPAGLIEQEKSRIIDNYVQQFPENIRDQVRQYIPSEEFAEQAQEQAHLAVIFNRALIQFKLEADPEVVKKVAMERAGNYGDPEMMVQMMLKNDKIRRNLEAVALEEQLVEKMLESATIENQTKDFSELMQGNQ